MAFAVIIPPQSSDAYEDFAADCFELQAGRSVKAESRTTDVHGGEESDFGVVPMKRSNKGAQARAE